MIATTDQQYTQEVGMEHLADEDRGLLDTMLQELRAEGPKWTVPPSKLDRALAAVLAGRVEPGYPEGLYHVQGTQGRYTVTQDGCTCPSSQKGRSIYCAHMTAVELYRRWQDARHGSGQAQLFTLAPTIEERLAAEPEDVIDFTTGEITDEESTGPTPTTMEDALALAGWSEPNPAEAWAARRSQDATTSLKEETVPTETLERPPEPETALEAPSSPQEPSSPVQAWHDETVSAVLVESAEKALAGVSVETQALAPRGPLVLFAEDLATWGAQRDMLMAFIKERLKAGVDYGRVHVVKDCALAKAKRVGECTKQSHWSKESLRKPGAEKVTTLLRLRPEFVRDQDTWEMLGSPAGVLCYRCLLVSPTGEIVGEGRAARDINKQDYGDINKGIKMAEKSAHLDAVIRVAGISDVFTQDLEDMSEGEEQPPSRSRSQASSHPTAAKQREEIWQLLRNHGFVGKTWSEAARRIEEWCGLRMHPDQYAGIIDALRRGPMASTGSQASVEER